MSTPLYALGSAELEPLNQLAVRAGYTSLDEFANAYGWSITTDGAREELESQINEAADDDSGAD